MFLLKFMLVVIFFFEVSTNVVAESNLTDVQSALELLNSKIQYSVESWGILYNVWDTFSKNLTNSTQELLKNETTKFNFVLSNLTVFAENVDSGQECVDYLLNRTTTINNLAISEDLIFSNLFKIAAAEIADFENQYNSLNNELEENCIRSQTNCEGTIQAVTAEVERLVPKLEKFPYNLIMEVYILFYKVQINLEDARAVLREEFSKEVQNATICLAAKIRRYKQVEVNSPSKTSETSAKSIADSYLALLTIVTIANSTSSLNLRFKVVDIAFEYLDDITDNTEIFDANFSQVNNTIDILNLVAQNSNATSNCNRPDIRYIFSKSLVRFYTESEPVIFDNLNRLYDKSANDIYDTAGEIYSIESEIRDCPLNPECDYLSDKIALKAVEIPYRIQKIENSTLVLFQQAIVAERESGARALRDALEQIEIGLLDLKSCLQYYL